MIHSMTAFARFEKSMDSWSALVEIRSYNSRHLDIALRVPHGYDALESKIREVIAGRLVRGRIEIRLRVQDETESAYQFEVNTPKALAYYQALTSLRETLGIEDPIPLEMMSRANDIIKPVEAETDLDTIWPGIQDTIEQAVAGLVEMRSKEGAFLAKDLKQRIDGIERNIGLIETESGNLVPQYQERLKERMAAVTKGVVDIDPGRIAQEAAFLADRSDISEEITRAKSHVQQFRDLMEGAEPAGRKLNFLLQEFNREFNTMGAKVGNADLSHRIVNVKSELEKIREQVQNIE